MDAVRSSYYEDVAVRSIQKNSAKHKANGSAVTKLGNKPITNKEIEEKHGPVVTYPSPDGLMSYASFVRLPNDLKIEFILGICDKYDIEIKHVSKYLFNKGDDGLRAYLRNNKLLQQCNPGKKRAKSGLLKFQADVEEWRRQKPFEQAMEEPEKPKEAVVLPLGQFMLYDDFKKLSIDDKALYVNSLILKYSVGVCTISKVLFKKSYTTLSYHFTNHAHKNKVEELKIKNPNLIKEYNAKFERAVREWENSQKTEEEQEVPVETAAAAAEVAEVPEVPETAQETPVEEPEKKFIKIPDDSEFELISVTDRLEEKLQQVEDNLVKAEKSGMEYHDMHYSLNYISEEINTEEIYAIAALVRQHKKPGNRVKVSFEVTEV